MSLKIEDLMINDLVLHNSRPEKVEKGILRELILDTSPYFRIKDYLPIPLTREILEKNGFVRSKYIERYTKLYNHFEVNVDFVHNEIMIHRANDVDTKDIFMEGMYFDCEVAFECQIQVHQLQHIMRLAGLNELADNLKV